jgi:uncharacterized protein (DUF983 family)
MPQRNSQNLVKSAGAATDPSGAPVVSTGRFPTKSGSGPHCPACGVPVQLRPGFRPSSQKCHKCGASLGKK